jgi:4-hydroxy-2-oxoheptanedioate aldolase
LALGLGLPPDLDKQEPEHVEAVQRILDACRRHEIIAGIQCGTGRSARAHAEKGFQLVTFTKDSNLLPAAVAKEFSEARSEGATALAGSRGYA